MYLFKVPFLLFFFKKALDKRTKLDDLFFMVMEIRP